MVTIFSDAGGEAGLQEIPRGSAPPAYGSGLLGIGKSKHAIYVCSGTLCCQI